MDALNSSAAKNTKSTETADTTTYQSVAELTNKKSVVITGAGPSTYIEEVTSRGVVGYFDSCNQNVQGDANSCSFTANMFRPERDSAKKQTKLFWYVFSWSKEAFPWRGTTVSGR